MVVPVLLFAVGLVLLIKGGDWFVDGAVGIARRFHVPNLLIGATVVSIGTTLPEVMVSASSAIGGHGEIAYGNALGSVICNAALIAAITIAVRPSQVERRPLYVPLIFFFAAALVYGLTAYTVGYFSRPIGIILLVMFGAYMAISVGEAVRKPALPKTESTVQPAESPEPEDGEPVSMGKPLALLVIGAALIAVGANLLVNNGVLIAQALGVPEAVIALTFVALGTSLPELVTAVTSLIKGHSDLSLGNIIGANLFNLVLVSGVSVTLAPFAIPLENEIAGVNSSLVLDIPVMLLVMLLLALPAVVKGRLYRKQGILLLVIYAAFCMVQFLL